LPFPGKGNYDSISYLSGLRVVQKKGERERGEDYSSYETEDARTSARSINPPHILRRTIEKVGEKVVENNIPSSSPLHRVRGGKERRTIRCDPLFTLYLGGRKKKNSVGGFFFLLFYSDRSFF